MINTAFWKQVREEWSIENIKTSEQMKVDENAFNVAQKTGGEVEDIFLDANSYLDSLSDLVDLEDF